MCVRVVVDFADTQFSNVAFTFLHENEIFAKLFLPVHMGPRSNLVGKKIVENLVTLSL